MLGSRPVPCSRSRRSGQSRRRTRRTRLPMRGGSRCPHDTHRQRQRPPRSQDSIPRRTACTTRQTPPCMRHTHLSQDGTHRGTRRRPVCCDECVVGHRACPSVFVDPAQTSHVALSRHSAQWASSQGTHAVPSGVSPLAHFRAWLSETNFPAPVRMSHFDAPGRALSAHRSGVPSTTPLRVFSGHDHTCRGPLRTPRRNRSRGCLCVGAVLDRRLPFRRALPEEQIALAAHVNASRWCSPSRTQRNASRQPLRASLQRGTPRCQGQRRTGTQRTRCLCISCTAPSPRRPDEQSVLGDPCSIFDWNDCSTGIRKGFIC